MTFSKKNQAVRGSRRNCQSCEAANRISEGGYSWGERRAHELASASEKKKKNSSGVNSPGGLMLGRWGKWVGTYSDVLWERNGKVRLGLRRKRQERQRGEERIAREHTRGGSGHSRKDGRE